MSGIGGLTAPVVAATCSPYRVADLRYRIVLGPVALEPLRILQQREILAGDWRIRFCVLGASHAIQLTRGAETVTELLACLPGGGGAVTGDSASPLLLLPPTRGSVSWDLPNGALAGRVELSRFDVRAIGDALTGDFDPECRLSTDFPSQNGVRLQATPRTRIGWRADGLQLEVETVHTYPEENAGLRSRTTFLLGESAK